MTRHLHSGSRDDTGGAVAAATHPVAAHTAISVLESGGNSVDAAVAAALCLTVVAPEQAGLGGAATCMHAAGADEPAIAISGAGKHVADTRVPGALGGLLETLAVAGSLPVADVFAPAIAAAGSPCRASLRFRSIWDGAEPWFTHDWPSTGEAYHIETDDDGLRFTRPALAQFLRDISEAAQHARRDATRAEQCASAASYFYAGSPAAAAADASLPEPWRIHRSDMGDFEPTRDPAVEIELADHRVALPPGSPVATSAAFAAALCLTEPTSSMADAAAEVHLIAESAKLAQADRWAWRRHRHHDAALHRELFAPSHLQSRCENLAGNASFELDSADPSSDSAVVPTPVTKRYRHHGERFEPYTANVIVADRHGAVTAISVHGGALTEGPVVPGWGFNLGGPELLSAPLVVVHRPTWGATAFAAASPRDAESVLAGALWRSLRQGVTTDAVDAAAASPAVGVQHAPAEYPPHAADLGAIRIAEPDAAHPDSDLAHTLRDQGHLIRAHAEDAVGALLAAGCVSGEWIATAAGKPAATASAGG